MDVPRVHTSINAHWSFCSAWEMEGNGEGHEINFIHETNGREREKEKHVPTFALRQDISYCAIALWIVGSWIRGKIGLEIMTIADIW